MSNNTFAQTVAGAVILVSIVAAIVVLALRGVLTSSDTFGLLTTIITLGGGALAVHSGAKVGARAAGVTEDTTTTTGK